MIGRIPSIVSALKVLRPKAQWTLAGNSYANLQWLDEIQTKPTEEEVRGGEGRGAEREEGEGAPHRGDPPRDR